MIVGDCAGASARLSALYVRTGVPADVAVRIAADTWCPVDDPRADAATRRRRLIRQTTTMLIDDSTCDLSVAPARALAKRDGASEPLVAAGVLTAVAKCMSTNRRCPEAHALLDEAIALVPGLTVSELTADCQ